MIRLLLGLALVTWLAVQSIRAQPGSPERGLNRGFALVFGSSIGLDLIPRELSVVAVLIVFALIMVAVWGLFEGGRALDELRD